MLFMFPETKTMGQFLYPETDPLFMQVFDLAKPGKNTKNVHNINLMYFSYTCLFLTFTKEIAGQMKKFTQI